MRLSRISVIILCTNEKRYLPVLFQSLVNQSYKNFTIYFIDNNSIDGSDKEIKNLKLKIKNLNIKIILNSKNFGYAKANNIGLQRAFKEGADLALVLNSDIICDKKLIENLVKSYLDKKRQGYKIGLLQPTILLAKDRKKINSVGNVIHYLGFGYCQDYLRKYKKKDYDKEIVSVSGAAMLISKQFYHDIGGFDEDFFMTAEDQDLSWRGLLYGYQHYLSSSSIVYHFYKFGRHTLNKYREERNRLQMILKNYSFKTLFLLSPALLINEMAILLYSLGEGWIFLKLKAYLVNLIFLPKTLGKRRIIQQDRVVSDGQLFNRFVSKIKFVPVSNFLIKKLANPLFDFYYQLISHFI